MADTFILQTGGKGMTTKQTAVAMAATRSLLFSFKKLLYI
jgi:hypothetical protein